VVPEEPYVTYLSARLPSKSQRQQYHTYLCSPEVAVDTQVGHIRRTVEESHNLEEGALHNPEEEAHHNLAGNRAGHHIDRGEDFAGT